MGELANGSFSPRKDIGRQDTADDVTQMRDIVDIRQSRGNEDIPLSLLGQNLFLVLAHDRVR